MLFVTFLLLPGHARIFYPGMGPCPPLGWRNRDFAPRVNSSRAPPPGAPPPPAHLPRLGEGTYSLEQMACQIIWCSENAGVNVFSLRIV